MLDGNSSAFDALSPFAQNQPAFHSELFSGNVSGPLGKKASFFVNVERRQIDDSNIVNAVVPTPQTRIQPARTSRKRFPIRETRTNVSPRLGFPAHSEQHLDRSLPVLSEQ